MVKVLLIPMMAALAIAFAGCAGNTNSLNPTFPGPGQSHAQSSAAQGSTAGMPTTKSQCMNGAWQTFGVFKSVGDCVGYVATGGRKAPAFPPTPIPHGLITEYPLPTANAKPVSIAAGADGALWFTEVGANKIARITTAGVFTEYALPSTSSFAGGGSDIAAGPDGALWFTEQSENKIGRITTAGIITEYPTGLGISGSPAWIGAGPDGALWFTDPSGIKVGRITVNGAVTVYPIPSSGNSDPAEITAGPDGKMWFAEANTGNQIGTVSTSGNFAMYASGISGGTYPYGITSGTDGNLWFTETGGNQIGRITTQGVVTEYPVPTSCSVWNLNAGITSGPDGALWFTENCNKIGRITTAGAISEFAAGLTADGGLQDIVTGSDGNLWFTEMRANRIGRIVP